MPKTGYVDIQRREDQIVHDTAHRINKIKQLWTSFENEATLYMNQILLDRQELESLREMRKKVGGLK